MYLPYQVKVSVITLTSLTSILSESGREGGLPSPSLIYLRQLHKTGLRTANSNENGGGVAPAPAPAPASASGATEGGGGGASSEAGAAATAGDGHTHAEAQEAAAAAGGFEHEYTGKNAALVAAFVPLLSLQVPPGRVG